MNARSLSRQLSLAFTVATLAAAARSEAQIIPLQSDRSIFAWVNFAGQPGHGQESHTEPNQFGPFIASADPTSWILGSCGEGEPDTCIVSLVEAHCAQNSSILDGGIQFSGYATGAWSGLDVGEYKFHSICKIRFILDIPVDYNLELAVDPGDLNPGVVFASLEGPTPDLTLHYTQYGTLHASGQLGPGEYVIQGRTITDTNENEYTSGGFYECAFYTIPIDTLKGTAGFPLDQTVACGGTATFSIGNPGAPGTLSYQWMRGTAPLANGGNISGANSPNLTLSNACSSDDGYYSVVATVIGSSPAVTIPSRFAHLTTVATTTGVAVDDVPASTPSFAPAAPNPFRSETVLHYTVPPSTRVTAAVYNASGTRVRGLTDAVLSGSGSIAWDGRTQAGERAPAGVYFLQLRAGAIRDAKKVVLLR